MTKYKKLSPFALIPLLIAALAACHPKATSVQLTNVEDPNSLLWEVSGKGLKTPSYLYGTIHIIPKADFFMTDATKKALNESPRVTFEINMKDMMNPTAIFSLISKATMKDGKRLKDLLSVADYQLVEKKFEETGFPLKMFERLKPMFLSAMMESGGTDDSSGKKESSTSYEMEFMKIAETGHKEFGGLETAEFQLAIFDSIPYDKQAAMLIKELKSKDNSPGDDMKTMIAMYKKQDINAMSKMIQEEGSDVVGYENLLLTDRNKNWIPIMAKMMAQEKTFFAVGAGHLGGEKGVINLLRKEGYAVKALK